MFFEEVTPRYLSLFPQNGSADVKTYIAFIRLC